MLDTLTLKFWEPFFRVVKINDGCPVKFVYGNDSKYWEEDRDGKFGNTFAMNSDHFDADLDEKRWKSWGDARSKQKHPDELGSVEYCDLGAISEGRNRVIRIKKQIGDNNAMRINKDSLKAMVK